MNVNRVFFGQKSKKDWVIGILYNAFAAGIRNLLSFIMEYSCMDSLPQPIAVGRTAEIYPWKDGQILKLYRDWCPADWAYYEARIARSVYDSGVPSPAVGELLEISGRRGITYERLDGPSMLISMSRSPLKLVSFARDLATLHYQIHCRAIPDLPSQRSGLVHDIQAAKALPDDLRQPVLDLLESLPDGSQLCHGDFHPDNVLMTRRGPIVIDWMTARQGSPAADVARTRMILSLGEPTSRLTRMLLLLARGLYLREYTETYRRNVPDIVQRSNAFLPVMAAARLNENIVPEREKLLQMVRSGLGR